MPKVLSHMSCGDEVSGVGRKAREDIQDLNSRTAAFSADGEIDTAANYQLPGLELVGHGQRKTVAGKLIVHR
jgi:hypothetical protein